jgi:uncharacterized protein (DUF488 family)
MRKKLYTIGHSTHSLEYFISLLKGHGVEAVCDVRSVPYSQYNPQFNRAPLTKELQRAQILYGFMGKELGARSDNPACYIDGKVQYSCLAEESNFLNGLQRIRSGLNSYRVALMCAERDPLMCHRTILVCRKLRSADLNIQHILADGCLETNEAAERRLVTMMNVRPDMLNSEPDCIELAYDKQASVIAYVKRTSSSVSR